MKKVFTLCIHHLLVFIACSEYGRTHFINITIGYLQSPTDTNSSISQLIYAVNSISNQHVYFKLKHFDMNQIHGDSSKILGSEIMSDVSIMIAKKVTFKISKAVTDILQIPLVTTDFAFCNEKAVGHNATCHHEISMSVDSKNLGRYVLEFLKATNISKVAVIFQTKLIAQLNSFMNVIGGTLIQKLFQVENDSNGKISQRSIRILKKLESQIDYLVVLIYDQEELPMLFKLFQDNVVPVCPIRMTLLYYGLLFHEIQGICDRHKFIGMQLEQAFNSTAAMHGGIAADMIRATKNPQDILLFDALFLATNVTLKMVKSSIWLNLTNYGLDWYHTKRANAANFTALAKQTRFQGVSGNVQINADNSRGNLTLNIVNTQQNKLKKIGLIHSETNSLIFNANPSENFPVELNDSRINGHLTVVTVVDEPFTFKPANASDSSTYTGFCIDILRELGRRLNFTYTIYLVEDGEYGREANGTWTGMIGDVLYKKADLAVASLTVTSTREKVVEFTKPYMETENSYVRKHSSMRQFDLFQYLKPFTTDVWIITVFAIIVSSFVIYGVDYYSPFGWRQTVKEKTGEEGNEFSVPNSIWFAVASWLLQGGDNTPRTLSGRIVVGTSWFVILIVTSTYTANMAAYFTFSRSLTASEDIESLLKEGVSFSLKKNTALDQFLLQSEYQVYRLLSENIRMKDKYVRNAREGIKAAQADANLLFLGEGPYSEWMINQFACDLKIVNGILPSRSYGFPVRIGSPHSEKISIGISSLEESRFIQKLRNYYWKELSSCKDVESDLAGISSDGRVEPLQMVGVYGCLVIAVILSIILLLVENWWKRNLQLKKRKASGIIQRVTSFRRDVREPANELSALPNIISDPEEKQVEIEWAGDENWLKNRGM